MEWAGGMEWATDRGVVEVEHIEADSGLEIIEVVENAVVGDVVADRADVAEGSPLAGKIMNEIIDYENIYQRKMKHYQYAIFRFSCQVTTQKQ